jgi:hypothetical protein
LPNVASAVCLSVYYCLFCEKPVVKIKQHLETRLHSDEFEVARLMSKKDDKREFLKQLLRIRNLGNHKHNCDVVRNGCGTLVVVYTPKEPVTCEFADEYVPCPYCVGYYNKKQLWRHCKNRCVWRPSDRTGGIERYFTKSGRYLLPVPPNTTSQMQRIILPMRNDDVFRAAVGDPLVMQYIDRLSNKHYHDTDKHEHVRCKLRELGRLLLQLRDHGVKTITEAVHPANFQKLTASVRKVAGFDTETNAFGTPSLALKLGHAMKKCAMILLSEALQGGLSDQEANVNRFIQLRDMDWSHEISTAVLNSLRSQRLNSSQLLPLAEDIAKLNSHLSQQSSEALDHLQDASTEELRSRFS